MSKKLTNPWIRSYQRSYQSIKAQLLEDLANIKDDNGNIIGIKDSAGNTVAEYSYTSKEFTTEVTTTNYTDVNIGDINSMLYENSYYDRETGFCCDYVYTNYIDGTPYQIKMFY